MINDIISKLIALQNFCKDVHYNCSGESAYSKHLLADRIQENINDYIDTLKENALLGAGYRPLPSAEYLQSAIKYIPEIKINEDKENFKSLLELIESIQTSLEQIETNRGVNKTLDDIYADLLNASALINLQLEE